MWIAKEKQHYTPLTEAVAEQGENGSLVWELKKTADNELTVNELKELQKANISNFQRAKEVKRLMKEGLRCSQIVIALHSKYSERAVKGDHAALKKAK